MGAIALFLVVIILMKSLKAMTINNIIEPGHLEGVAFYTCTFTVSIYTVNSSSHVTFNSWQGHIAGNFLLAKEPNNPQENTPPPDIATNPMSTCQYEQTNRLDLSIENG